MLDLIRVTRHDPGLLPHWDKEDSVAAHLRRWMNKQGWTARGPWH